MVRAACVPASHSTVTIEETVLVRLPPPGYYTDNRLKHTPQFFCDRGLFACPDVLAWGAGFRISTNLEAYRYALGECKLEDTISTLYICLAITHWYLPEGSLYTHLQPQMTRPDHLVWWSAGLVLVVPEDYIYFHTLNIASWESSFHKAWN